LPPTGPEQARVLQPGQHQVEHGIRPALFGQLAAELRQDTVIEARIAQLAAERVLPRDPVDEGFDGLAVGEVVAELQNHGHQQQCREQARLPQPGEASPPGPAVPPPAYATGADARSGARYRSGHNHRLLRTRAQLRANSRRSALNVSANLGTMARPWGAPG
jgi:hypothetical protein